MVNGINTQSTLPVFRVDLVISSYEFEKMHFSKTPRQGRHDQKTSPNMYINRSSTVTRQIISNENKHTYIPMKN